MPTVTAHRRFKSAFAAGIMALVGLTAIVILSPLILHAAMGPTATWTDVATVGQAYGGVAALISAIALVAIAVSLFLQWKQARLAEIFMVRERHFDLVRLGLDRPDLLAITTGSVHGVDADQRVYANLWFMHWTTRWDLGSTDEDDLRRSAAWMFESPVVRDWWRDVAPRWTSYMASFRRRQNKRFVDILNDEWQRASGMQSGSEVPSPAAGET